jgi:hypothetical protein
VVVLLAKCIKELHGRSFKAAFIPRSDGQSMYTRSGRRALGRLGAAPFVDGDDHGSIHASAGDDLRTFFDGVVDKFTETRFRVVQLPFGRGLGSRGFNDLTSQSDVMEIMAGPRGICRSDRGGTAWCLAASENPT